MKRDPVPDRCVFDEFWKLLAIDAGFDSLFLIRDSYENGGSSEKSREDGIILL